MMMVSKTRKTVCFWRARNLLLMINDLYSIEVVVTKMIVTYKGSTSVMTCLQLVSARLIVMMVVGYYDRFHNYY